MASKLATLMRRAMPSYPAKIRIMTDLTGVFNKVVMETEMDNLAEFDKRMEEYRKDTMMREKMAGYTEMYKSGKREIYQVHE